MGVDTSGMNDTLTHGGDWAGFLARRGVEPLDLSSNISPLGVPAGVQRAITQAVRLCSRYPDPLCRELRAALSAQEQVAREHILCGCGAADLIYRAVLALRPGTALIPAPAFSEYEAALALVDCRVTLHPLRAEDGFRLGEDILSAIRPGLDLLFLCQPNNPTGLTTPRPLLERILTRCGETGTRVILDECFIDLLDDPASHTLVPQLEKFPHMLVLKAFTKLYALAGVRLGYALCADRGLLERMERAGQPWSVSVPAQAAGLAALEDRDYPERVRTLLRQERPFLARALEALGLQVLPGEANYLLFRCETPLLEPLAQRGILLRGCADYHGLDGSWYRTAVRTHRENLRLLEALREVLA